MLNQLWESVQKQEARLDEKLYESVLKAAKGVQALNERANLTDVELAQAIKMLDAAKRGLGLTNKLTGEDKRKHASRVMGNLNRIRAFVAKRLKAVPEENEEFDFDQFFDDSFDDLDGLEFDQEDVFMSAQQDSGFDEGSDAISFENEEAGAYGAALSLARKLTAKGMKADQAAMMAGQRFNFDEDECEVLHLDMTRNNNGFEENEEFGFDDDFSGDAFDQFDGLDFDTEYEDDFEEFAHLSPEEAEFARGSVDVRPEENEEYSSRYDISDIRSKTYQRTGNTFLFYKYNGDEYSVNVKDLDKPKVTAFHGDGHSEIPAHFVQKLKDFVNGSSEENEEVKVDQAKEALVKKHQVWVANDTGSKYVGWTIRNRVRANVSVEELKKEDVTDILYRWDDYDHDNHRGTDVFTAKDVEIVDALRYAWNKEMGYEQLPYGHSEAGEEDYTDVSMRRGEMGIADRGVRESVEGKRSFINYLTETVK